MDSSVIEYPKDIQGLFNLAVTNTRFLISERGSRKDWVKLYYWAQEFAKEHGLKAPDMEMCGIYYPIEEDEMP